MNVLKMRAIFLWMGLLVLSTNVFSQDPDFHIYLCFGQSNMEGQGGIGVQDRTVDSRFQVMEALDCSNLERTKGSWYTATPPLCRCNTGLSPADYFGRTMIANLPSNIRVGVVHVAVAGCRIELFDKDNYEEYASTAPSWMTNIINEYGGNPYGRLVEIAELAQQDGVIKGILLHQGESNVGDSQWTSKVKGVYDNLINDLGLDPDAVPLLAGEVVHAEQGGVSAGANPMIATLPQTLPNSHVISSRGCTDAADNLHFNSAGYRELGRRYAVKMLSLQGYEVSYGRGTEAIFLESECATVGDNWEVIVDEDASNGGYVSVKAGLESLSEAPSEEENIIHFPFTVDSAGHFDAFARVKSPTENDDSYWIKIDDGTFVMVDGLGSGGWQWVHLTDAELAAGEHTLTIAYREDGAQLDKLCISDYLYAPDRTGEEAENICEPPAVLGVDFTKGVEGYTLGQNHPNPFTGITNISFDIPKSAYVSLKVYNMLGVEVAELAGKMYAQGTHAVAFDSKNLSKGIYFYTLETGKFSASRKLMVGGK